MKDQKVKNQPRIIPNLDKLKQNALFSLIRLSFVFVFCFTPTSCGSFDLGSEPATEINVKADNPEWAADIQFLMQLKCMNCHADPKPTHAPSKTPKIALDDKTTFGQRAIRIKQIVIDQSGDPKSFMPPNFGTPLSSLEKLALKNYICTKTEDTSGAIKAACTTDGKTPPVDNNVPKPGTTAGLSSAFGVSCSCHGPAGQAQVGGAFVIAGTKLDLATFKNVVRSGRKGSMPSFTDLSKYSDTTLEADWKFLSTGK